MSATIYRRPFVRHPKRRWVGGNFLQSFRGFFDPPSPAGGAGPDTVNATVVAFDPGSPGGGEGSGSPSATSYDAPSPSYG